MYTSGPLFVMLILSKSNYLVVANCALLFLFVNIYIRTVVICLGKALQVALKMPKYRLTNSFFKTSRKVKELLLSNITKRKEQIQSDQPPSTPKANFLEYIEHSFSKFVHFLI